MLNCAYFYCNVSITCRGLGLGTGTVPNIFRFFSHKFIFFQNYLSISHFAAFSLLPYFRFYPIYYRPFLFCLSNGETLHVSIKYCAQPHHAVSNCYKMTTISVKLLSLLGLVRECFSFYQRVYFFY